VTAATNIPTPHDRFVGRKEEMRDVRQAIADHPIVTLAGPGGAGKTRLAIEAAGDTLSRYADGVWLVPLGSVRTGAEVAALTARTLGLAERAGEPAEVSVCTGLRHRELLLVLDNCEHLLEPVAALVTEVLDECPSVRVLATSRELLRCRGERAIAVSSLPTGEPGRPATELFIDRATSGAPGLAHCLEGRALIELEAGEPAVSCALLDEVLTIFTDMDNAGCIAHALEATAAVLVLQDELFDAGRLVGAAAELRTQVGQAHRPWEREGLARTERAFAGAPPAVDLDQARREGEALTLPEAVSLARRLLAGASVGPEGPTDAGREQLLGLSPREADVLRLLADGCGNREIGERLFMSVKTVERHLGNLYRKLDVTNRTQAAAYAIRHGLGSG
jgi:DNA-binding CsgD family transcriptional regulator